MVKLTINNALTRIEVSYFWISFFAAVFALLTMSAQAQCPNGWDASGTLRVMQGTKFFNPTDLKLTHQGTGLSGTAQYEKRTGPFKSITVNGSVTGTLVRDSFSIEVAWQDGLTGIYNGRVLPSGLMEGQTYAKHKPGHQELWRTERVLNCAAPLPPPPKVIKSSGRTKPAPKPSADAPVKTSSITPKPPFINAGQAIIPTPTHRFGIVVLEWDGGPDHPNAEVWLSINNGAEIPAFSIGHTPQSPLWKQPKIVSIPLQLQRNHHYKFVLKAAGKTLSSAAFVVR